MKAKKEKRRKCQRKEEKEKWFLGFSARIASASERTSDGDREREREGCSIATRASEEKGGRN